MTITTGPCGAGVARLAETSATDLEDAVDALVHRSAGEQRSCARQCRRHRHHRRTAAIEVTGDLHAHVDPGPLPTGEWESLRLVRALADVGDLTETLCRVSASRSWPRLSRALQRDLLVLREVGAAVLREVDRPATGEVHALRVVRLRAVLRQVLVHHGVPEERDLWLACRELTRALLAVAEIGATTAARART